MKFLLIIFALLFLFVEASVAQDWVPTNGPSGEFDQILFNSKKDIFISAGTLIRSTDNGTTWKQTVPQGFQGSPKKIAIAPNQEIYMQSDSTKIWRSVDNGDSWTVILSDINILNFFIDPSNTIYVFKISNFTNHYPFLRSKNFGKSWDSLSIPINGALQSSKPNAYAIDSNGILIFGSYNGIFRSEDQGSSWQHVVVAYPGDAPFSSIACTQSAIYCTSQSGNPMTQSTDGGLTWNELSYSGLGSLITSKTGRVLFIQSGNGIDVTNRVIRYSDDGGKRWNNYKLGPDGFPNGAYTDADSGFYFGCSNYSMAFHSSSPQSTWQQVNFPTGRAYALISYPNGQLVAASGFSDEKSTIWLADSLGFNWKFIADSGWGNTGFFILDSSKNIIFIDDEIMFRSTDSGKTWSQMKINLSVQINCILTLPNGDIVVGSNSFGTFKSEDGGFTWNWDNSSVSYSSFALSHDSTFYRAYYIDEFRNIYGAKGNPPSGTDIIKCLATDLYDDIFAVALSQTGGIRMFRSAKMGQTWSEFGSGLNCTYVYSLLELPDGSIAASTDSGVFILPLGGCKWESYSEGLWTKKVPSIAVSKKGELYVGTDGCGVFKSTKTFGGPPKFTGFLSPDGIMYDTITVGETNCKNAMIKNTGFVPLIITSYAVTDPTPFSVTSKLNLPVILNPNDSIIVNICFHPSQPAVYASSIIWNTDIDSTLCEINRETTLNGVAVVKSDASLSSYAHFSLYPNPANGNSLFITQEIEQPASVIIFDVLGTEVLRKEISTQETEISISELPSGLYYFYLKSGGKIFTDKFVRL